MVKWLFISAVALGGAGGVLTIFAFRQFDRLLRLIWTDRHEEWVVLGKPCGFFWVPQEVRDQGLARSSEARAGLLEAFSESPPRVAGLPKESLATFRRTKRLATVLFLGALASLGLTVCAIFIWD